MTSRYYKQKHLEKRPPVLSGVLLTNMSTPATAAMQTLLDISVAGDTFPW